MLDVSILDTRRGPVGTELSTGTAEAACEKAPPGNEPHAGNGAFGVRAPSANVGAWQPRSALRRSESTSPRAHFSDWAQGACRCLRVQGLEPTVGNVPCSRPQRVAPEGMISPQKKRPRFRRRPPVLRSPEEGLRAAQSCRRYTPRLSARQTRRTEASPPGCPAAAHRRSRGH